MTAAKSNVSRIPASSRKPRNRPAPVAAREAEAGDGYVILEQCGVKLRIPIDGKVPLLAVDAFRDGDNYGGTKAMIGDEQWKRLLNAGATRDDLNELGGKLNEAQGN